MGFIARSFAQGSSAIIVQTHQFFVNFQTKGTHFRILSNVSHHFSNIFEYFQTFSNVFTLPVLPNCCILTHQPPFLPQKPISPSEKYSQKSPFFQNSDNFSPKFDSFV